MGLTLIFSAPGLSWDTMLKMTGVKLERISGIKKYLFIEKGLKGAISWCAKANTKYMNHYDPKKPSYGGFKWLKKLDHFDVNSISKKIW